MRKQVDDYMPQLSKYDGFYVLPYELWNQTYSYGIPNAYLYDNLVQVEIDYPDNPAVIDIVFPETQMFDPHIEYKGEYRPDEEPEVLYIVGIYDE